MTVITELSDWSATYPPTGYSEAGTTGNIGPSSVITYPGAGQSLRIQNGSAATAWIADTTALRTICMGLGFYIATGVSGTASVIQLTNATIGNIYFRLLTTPGTRLTLNATNYAGPLVSTGVWYWLDLLANTTANPTVVDWAIDEVAQTQRTIAGTAADMTAVNTGIITSVTTDLYIGPYKVTDSAADYPIGPWAAPVTDAPFQFVNAGYYP